MQARDSRRAVVSPVAIAVLILLPIAGAALIAFPAAATTTVNDPIILKASVSGGTLTIEGSYLGVNEPTVQLGLGPPLGITSFSPTLVVATMPPGGLSPGTYRLLYTKANGLTAILDLTIGAPSCPGGTCSTTTTQACAYDKDCPTGETCLDPIPRFVHGNGTVKDMRTCLEWEKKTGTVGATNTCWPGSPEPCTQSPDFHNVNNAYGFLTDSTDPLMLGAFLANLNAPPGFAGHTDWRLPTSGGSTSDPSGSDPELESILLAPYPCATSPCIDTTVFGPTASAGYWSSTPIGEYYVWTVNFGNGGTGINHQWNASFVRAVRGGPGVP